jgi:hypothetical protein
LINSLLDGRSDEDGGRPDTGSGEIDEALKELEGDALNMFDEDDF